MSPDMHQPGGSGDLAATDRPARALLRVGLLVDSLAQPCWVRQIVRDIQASPVARIVLVLRNAAAGPAASGGLRRHWHGRAHLLYSLYTAMDEYRVALEHDALAPGDITPLVVDCPMLDVMPVVSPNGSRLAERDVARIAGHGLDVALRFGFDGLDGCALDLPRHGVWSYRHGDDATHRGGPPGFWEVMEGDLVTSSLLEARGGTSGGGKILARTWSSGGDIFSVKKNRNGHFWKAAGFVLRKLRELHETGRVEGEGEEHSFQPYSNRLYGLPSNSELLAPLARLTCSYVASKARRLFTSFQWTMAFRFSAGPADPNDAFHRFIPLDPPRDRSWADPFPVQHGERHFLFFEELLHASPKAHIAVCEIDRNGLRGEPRRVLERDYHLSYPFVFEWQGQHYMIPESSASNRVELYRCTSFPDRWELDRVLMENVRAADATLIERDGRWWMFASVVEGDVPYEFSELHLYHADTPLGPWRPHRRNPVKSDVRGSRPAGRLFHWNGQLYRPAQDCSRTYGYAMSLNRVTQLDTEAYAEVEVSRILPRWRKDLICTHTLNSAGALTVIDCLVERPKLF